MLGGSCDRILLEMSFRYGNLVSVEVVQYAWMMVQDWLEA